MSRQAGEEDRLARADRVIRNDGDLAEVKREVKKVYEYYCGGENPIRKLIYGFSVCVLIVATFFPIYLNGSLSARIRKYNPYGKRK